jgi:hypothetical protein
VQGERSWWPLLLLPGSATTRSDEAPHRPRLSVPAATVSIGSVFSIGAVASREAAPRPALPGALPFHVCGSLWPAVATVDAGGSGGRHGRFLELQQQETALPGTAAAP